MIRARIAARVGRRVIDVELDTGPGTLVVVGPNGAGKTSLLSLLIGARPIDRGRVEIGGCLLVDTTAGIDVPLEHRRIGYVPQDYALFPHLTVRQNVEFALGSTRSKLKPAERTRRVDAILDDLGIDALGGRRPHTLSGGEKQRVALARALSVGPRALLLDEPLSALDVHSRAEVRAFLGRWLDQLGLPTIVVTHDPAEARALGRRIAVLEAGTLVQTGTWSELQTRPASRFIEAFVSRAA